MLQVNCHNPHHQQGNEPQQTGSWGRSDGQSTSGWEEEDEAGGVRSEKNDMRIPGVCEHDSILKKGKRWIRRGSGQGGSRKESILRNESQVKAGLAIRPMGSGASELLGWVSYLIGPRENEAQKLGWDLKGRLMDPSWQGWSKMGMELSSPNHQQVTVLLAFITFCCQWLHHHPPHPPPSHTHLEPKANYALREIQIPFAYSCEKCSFPIYKSLRGTVVIYLSYLILKKKNTQ